MTLTTEQKQALERGEPVETVVDGIRCVLISREAYEQRQQESNIRETYPAILKAWDSQGSPDDATDYQDLA